MTTDELIKRKDELIKELLAAGKIKRSDKTVEQLENSRKKLKDEISTTWNAKVKHPNDVKGEPVALKEACLSKKCNPTQIEVTSNNTKYDDITYVLTALSVEAIKANCNSTVAAANAQFKNYEMMKNLNELLALLPHGDYAGDIKDKKDANGRLGHLKTYLKQLGKAKEEQEIRKYALKCANLIKDFAWWRVSGKGTNKEKEENKRKNTGWALARVLFPKEKMPNLLNTMTLLVNMYFLGYKTSLLSLSSVPVRLLRKNTKLAIKKQYDFRNKGDWYTTTEENTEEIKGTANKTEKKDKIEQKELEAFFKELDNIKDPKPSKIASFFKKKSK